jgi:hypothetical protein
MTDPTFNNNNNYTNPPTPIEIKTGFRNFRSMNTRYSVWADMVISRTPNIIYSYEEVVEDPDYDGWFEPYIYYHTLHVFYLNDDQTIQHKIYKFTYDDQVYGSSTFHSWNLYAEEQPDDFDYDTIRQFKFFPVECPPAPI